MRAPVVLVLVVVLVGVLASAACAPPRDPIDVSARFDAGAAADDAGALANDAGAAAVDAGAGADDAGALTDDAGAVADDAGATTFPDAGTTFDPDAGPAGSPYDVVVDVPLTGPYGTRTIAVPARTNWASTGLYLRAGETAVISASGTWTAAGIVVGPTGDPSLGTERGCAKGSLVARSGLSFEGALTCVGSGATFTAPEDGIVYVGMIFSTDLGETYGDRLRVDGQLDVVVTSDGDTAPMIPWHDLEEVDLQGIASGVVEVVGRRIILTLAVDDVLRDASTAQASVATLDAIWDDELVLRGTAPFSGQRVRFVRDDAVESFAYMLAGNPVRCVAELLSGAPDHRLLRAAVPTTDVWGFAHELGHAFSFANGTWVFQYNNIEAFPNLFTLHALEMLDREDHQPNVATYCDGRAAYLATGTYQQFKDDPFLELCFLMEFTDAYGWTFWQSFWALIDVTANDAIPIGGTPEHANTWGWLRDALSTVAAQDVTPRFDAWRVPLPP